MTGHTKTPWDYWADPISGTFRLRHEMDGGENRVIIGHVGKEENSAFIVEAVNTYDRHLATIAELVEAVELALEHLGLQHMETAAIQHAVDHGLDRLAKGGGAVTLRLRAAISAAKGGK